MPEIENLAAALKSVATPGLKPKELIAAVRKHHPEASKKEIVRAAFYALTQGADGDAEQARDLHALGERASEEVPAAKRLRKKVRRKETAAQRSTHQPAESETLPVAP